MLGNKIKTLRNELNISQEELAKKINVSPSTIAMYETNRRQPNYDVLLKLSNIFECSMDYLLGNSDKRNSNKTMVSSPFINIPVIGKIAAGKPILAQENIEGILPVDPKLFGITNAEEYFYLRVSGNSMNQKIKNGDFALIHKQNYAESGDIIVAIVNGDDEATIKKYKKINDSLIALEPQSDDSSYETIYIDKNTRFQIIGKAIGQFGKF